MSLEYIQHQNVITKKIPENRLYTHMYSETCVKLPLSKRAKNVFNTNYCLMEVKSIAEYSKGGGAFCNTFDLQ